MQPPEPNDDSPEILVRFPDLDKEYLDLLRQTTERPIQPNESLRHPDHEAYRVVFYKIARLQEDIRALKLNDRSDTDRQMAICLTELESVEARWAHFVQGR